MQRQTMLRNRLEYDDASRVWRLSVKSSMHAEIASEAMDLPELFQGGGGKLVNLADLIARIDAN